VAPWGEFCESGEVAALAGRHQTVEPIELLDEDVDLTPARHVPQPELEVDTAELNAASMSLAEHLSTLGSSLPRLRDGWDDRRGMGRTRSGRSTRRSGTRRPCRGRNACPRSARRCRGCVTVRTNSAR